MNVHSCKMKAMSPKSIYHGTGPGVYKDKLISVLFQMYKSTVDEMMLSQKEPVKGILVCFDV